MKKTLVLFYPGCIEYEIMLAAQLFHSHLPIDLATPDGADLLGDSGLTFRATHSYANVQPDEYLAVLVPGGDPTSVLDHPRLDWILKTAAEAGAAVGGICAGPLLLAKAGILKGKRFTHGYSREDADFCSPFWAGGQYDDQRVITDGKIVTARPEAHVEFGVELLYAAGLRAEFAVKYMQSHELFENYATEIEAVEAFYRG